TLNVSGAISGATFGVTKLLPGTLVYSGPTANTYTGTTSMSEGTLQLNKTAGFDAIAGPLTVGNDQGGANADLVQLLASDPINDAVVVVMTPSGRLDLNNFNETLGGPTGSNAFNIFNGLTYRSTLTTG